MKSPPKKDETGRFPVADTEDTNVARPPREDELPLPFERDEAPDTPPDAREEGRPRQVIEQAASDVARGLVDTERRGIPTDVPAPAPPPEHSPGASVPEEGVDVAGHSRSRRPDHKA
ncbi:hypothetical protein [Azoarcus olearius]|uniref:Uncharacterized protein n=1 Tax=Azoarcus sp. (strain BH72) TaxID=418699 RepID=A1K6H5_AZOSB|nr:hypothetical protein [Azoarcus olearius]CAL94430.1 Hypothetical protein azo1813 [Azoarcus olearius]